MSIGPGRERSRRLSAAPCADYPEAAIDGIRGRSGFLPDAESDGRGNSRYLL